MSCVTRKRTRAEAEEELSSAERKSVQDEGAGGPVRWHTGAGCAAEGEGRDGEMFKKDDEFWFDDGTVVLIACDVEFRVYRGVLASHSPVFKDLFAQRHPLRTVGIDAQVPTLCPVIRVSDSPEDLRYLLRAFVSRRFHSLYDAREPSFDEVSAAIRLGGKYQIPELSEQSISYLKRWYPSDFDVYIDLPHFWPSAWRPGESLRVINLARLTGELSMLPAAFVACTRDGPAVVHGLTLEDGSVEVLSPDDLATCFNATVNIREATITAVLRTFKPAVPPDCRTPKPCRTALLDALRGLEANVSALVKGDPFMFHHNYLSRGKAFAVCAACASMVEERNLLERKAIWNRLPQLLGIDVPGWGQPPVTLAEPQAEAV